MHPFQKFLCNRVTRLASNNRIYAAPWAKRSRSDTAFIFINLFQNLGRRINREAIKAATDFSLGDLIYISDRVLMGNSIPSLFHRLN